MVLIYTSIESYNWFKKLCGWVVILSFNLIEFHTTFFAVLNIFGLIKITFIE